MKQKHNEQEESGFWVKLIGMLAAVSIVVILIFGGVQSVLGQIMDLQRQLDQKTIQFDIVSGQLAEANRELGVKSTELDEIRNSPASMGEELENAHAMLVESREELAAAKSQLDTVERQLRDKASELFDARAQITELSTELSESTAKLEATQKELAVKNSLCASESGFAELDSKGIEFDLLCRPLYPKTIELKNDKTLHVKVNLAQFREAYEKRNVRFRIHFAIDHGRLEIQELGSVAVRKLSDSGGRNLRDIEISTTKDVIEFVITDVGYRRAKFDLSVWPL